MPYAHTLEQEAILSAAHDTKDNLMISALAGCGKTSTLEAIEKVVPRGPALYLVFNKKNATEAEGRMQSTTTVRTFNSIGHRIWAASQAKGLKVDADKTRNIFKEIATNAPSEHRDAVWSVYSEVVSGVGMAKALGYVPEGAYAHAKRLLTQAQFYSALDEEPDELAGDLIDAILTRSIKLSYEGTIDYNDQIYMPALFGGTYPRFPLVLVDEYQDLSPVNHALLSRLVKGRLIGVGDPNQNIYGFRGAKAGGMREAIASYSCQELPLTTSFRCPSAIVKHVLWHVPTFRAAKEGGNVVSLPRLGGIGIREHSTVICRNNAPLLKLAFNLLGAGRSVSVAGGDIGPRIVGVMRKLGPDDLSGAGLIDAINDWEQAKLAKESKTAGDMAACMRIFAEHGRSLSGAMAYAKSIFEQKGTTYLTTGHKAKGLEWQDVYHLDPWHVRRGHPSLQDRNLDYVISTRSFDKLTEIDSEGLEW
jgi:superfamily I DNA/RNA helicase